MPTRPASHLFYDSAATLRMVDSALDDLRVPAPHAGPWKYPHRMNPRKP